MDDLPPISFVCWSCQAVTPLEHAVELRRGPREIIPCCLDCWATLTAAQRLATAQAFYDSQRRLMHQRKLELAAEQASIAVDRSLGALGAYLGDYDAQ